MHICIRCTPISAGQITKKNEVQILNMMKLMNIINDNTFNLYNSLLNNDIRYMKVNLKQILNLHMAYKMQGNFKRYSE